MSLSSLLLCLSLGVLAKYVSGSGSEWCYNGCVNSPDHWKDMADSFCGNKRQSPIDIVTSHVQTNHNLVNFTFVKFSSQNVLHTIENNGHTVKCTLKENEVEVSGGGLNDTYSTIQFHFHWGDSKHHPGSEHTIDGHRYPMEMHIVSLKKGLTVSEAVKDSEGIAVLGFFINATDDGDMSGPWSSLTSYLNDTKDTKNITHKISINDLIGNVDVTKFYRYMGSLTTPLCNEAVVWTIFQEPINVNKELIQKFATETGISNVYRPPQNLNGRHVYASPATPLPPSHPWCYDDHCKYSPSHWHLLPHSYCGDKRQSPINIETKSAVTDLHLDAFTFTKFDDKHVIVSITNTGHSVKCVLKEDMVEVSGGGLGYVYSTLQFHFHWGSESHDSVGSEHTVNSKRYPMEMHIVNKRKDLTLEEAIKTPNGLAVLGFFIEAPGASRSGGGGSDHHESSTSSTPTSDMDPWNKLTGYLSKIQNTSSKVDFKEELSINDLLGNVNRTSYFRYNGSLTTPSCNEAVVWTVFKESVKVHQNLMTMFPNHTRTHNVFRPTQSLQGRTIYTTAASSVLGPIIPFLLLASLCHFFV